MLFIDSDMLFAPEDAVKPLRSDEPVIAGAYAAKKLGNGQLNVAFEDESHADPVRGLGQSIRTPSRRSGPGCCGSRPGS